MRLRAALRWSWAPVLMSAYVISSLVYVLPGADLTGRYGPGIVADAEYALRVISPLSAGMCAFLGGQASRYVDGRTGVRGWRRGMLALTWPALVAAAISYLVVIGILAGLHGAPTQVLGPRSLLMVLTGQSVLLAWGLVGIVAGSVAHRLLAPILVIALHLLLTWAPALAVPWPRLLTGIQYGCCTPTSRPDPAALWFTMGLAAALIGTAWISSVHDRVRRRATLSLGLGASAAGLSLAASLLPLGDQYLLAQPRPDETVCLGSEPQVCLWPENRQDLPVVSDSLGDAHGAWVQAALPLPLPDRVSDYTDEVDGPGLNYLPGTDRAQVQANAAYSALIAHGGGGYCAQEVPGVQVASIWMVRLVGSDTTALRLPPEIQTAVDEVTARPMARQLAWFSEVTDALAGCPR